MYEITGYETYRLSCDGNLKKRLIAWVRQKIGKWGRSYEVASVLNMVQESNNLVYRETELCTAQNFAIFC